MPIRPIALIAAILLGTTMPAGAQDFGRNKVQFQKLDFKVLSSEHFDVYYYPQEEAAVRIAPRRSSSFTPRIRISSRPTCSTVRSARACSWGSKAWCGPFPLEMAFFGDAGVAWSSTQKPKFAGGDRDWVRSAGVALRANVLGYAIAEIDLITDGPQRHRDTEKPFSKYFSKKALVFRVQFLEGIPVAERQELPWHLRDAESSKKELSSLCSLWPVRDLIL